MMDTVEDAGRNTADSEGRLGTEFQGREALLRQSFNDAIINTRLCVNDETSKGFSCNALPDLIITQGDEACGKNKQLPPDNRPAAKQDNHSGKERGERRKEFFPQGFSLEDMGIPVPPQADSEPASELSFMPEKSTIQADNQERYLMGIELAFAAIVAISGIVPADRRRAKVTEDDCFEESECEDEDADEHGSNLPSARRRTYSVKAGDSLQGIAEDVFRNRDIAWLIADINAANIKEEWIGNKRVVELKPRQCLELPEPGEATYFASRIAKDFNIDRLVTVISESAVDCLMLNIFLGPVSGRMSQPQLAS
jgi:hypothetical protein